ncbi:MAG: MBL fold metallo-hydrolase [Planctomycetota bacterium]
MKATFWGVRGSLPTPLTTNDYHRKLARILAAARGADLTTPAAIGMFCEALPPELRRVVGGNTACVEINGGPGSSGTMILDAGSGIRPLGHDLLARAKADPSFERTVHVLISHTHWDHICGFPFFLPLYDESWDIHIWGAHPDMEERMRSQHHPNHFPVPFEHYQPRTHVHQLEVGQPTEVGGLTVIPGLLEHPGDCYSYRISQSAEAGGGVLVYGTDGSYRDNEKLDTLLDSGFWHGADALIFDAMFTWEESLRKPEWGHSTARVGIDLCVETGVKQLILFHHDPDNDDLTLYRILREAEEYVAQKQPAAQGRLLVDLACEGWSFSVPAAAAH